MKIHIQIKGLNNDTDTDEIRDKQQPKQQIVRPNLGQQPCYERAEVEKPPNKKKSPMKDSGKLLLDVNVAQVVMGFNKDPNQT